MEDNLPPHRATPKAIRRTQFASARQSRQSVSLSAFEAVIHSLGEGWLVDSFFYAGCRGGIWRWLLKWKTFDLHHWWQTMVLSHLYSWVALLVPTFWGFLSWRWPQSAFLARQRLYLCPAGAGNRCRAAGPFDEAQTGRRAISSVPDIFRPLHFEVRLRLGIFRCFEDLQTN